MCLLRWLVAGVLLALVALTAALFVGRFAARPPPEFALEISTATTRVVAPLTPDGRVDFRAALDTETPPDPGDNAAVPLLRVLGTKALAGDPAWVLERLGVTEPLPEEGTFVPEPPDLPRFDSLEDLDDEADRKRVRDWLTANARAFEDLVEASRRPRLWSPVVPPADEGLLAPALPVHRIDLATNALLRRAQVRLAERDLRGAWDDLRALLRLADLIAQESGAIPALTATGLRRRVLDPVAAVLGMRGTEEALLREIQAELSRPLPPAHLRDDLDRWDRIVLLDAYVRRCSGGSAGEAPIAPEEWTAVNAALREVNRELDEVVPFLPVTDAAGMARLGAHVEERHRHVQELNKQFKHPDRILAEAVRTWRSRGRRVGTLTGTVLAAMLLYLLPLQAERALLSPWEVQVVRTAAAVRMHARLRGRFPASLDELVPELLPAIPRHPLTGEPVPYELGDGGCTLGEDVDPVSMEPE